MTAFVFLRAEGESNGDALARCAEEVLAPGPMAATVRGDDYAAFLEQGFFNGHTLRTRATSCGIFAGTCAIVSGSLPRRAIPAPAITLYVGFGGFGGAHWIPADLLPNGPRRGDVLYICSTAGQITVGGKVYTWHRWEDALNGHVIVVRENGWVARTAEGGGSPGGTGCHLSAAPKDLQHLGRPPRGVWRPDPPPAGSPTWVKALEAPHADTDPAPAPASSQPSRTLRKGMSGPDVEKLQAQLGKITVDGSFGPQTDARVREFQQVHGLVADGVVGPKTWAKLGGP